MFAGTGCIGSSLENVMLFGVDDDDEYAGEGDGVSGRTLTGGANTPTKKKPESSEELVRKRRA